MADTRELDIVLSLKDKISKELGTVQNKIKDLQPTFQKMALVGTAAFGAVTLAVKKSIDAYQAQERAEARLEQLIGNVVRANMESVEEYENLAAWQEGVRKITKLNTDALKEQASALQQLGVVGDEVTIVGQSQLATFALTGRAIKQLTPGMLDLVVATKGVNATQEDMINIGNLVGKVMTGQVGALSRLGITFSETQEEILKTGNEMERAQALADVLSQNFGGLNEAARNTSEGGIQALKNDLGDLMEIIGEQFIASLGAIVQKIRPIIASVQEWVKQNPELTKNIILAVAAMSGFVAIAGALGLILPSIIAGIGFLVSPIGLVTVGLTALVGVFVAFHDRVGEVFQLIDEKTGIITLMQQAWDAIVTVFNEELMPALSELWAQLTPFIPILQKVAEIAGGILVLSFKLAITVIGILVIALGKTLTLLAKVATFVIEKFVDAFNFMKEQFAPVIAVVERLVNILKSAWEWAGKVLSKAGNFIGISGGGGVEGKAIGGPVSGGTPYVVGERGPELFVPRGSGTIIPNGAMAGAGGGMTVNVVVNGDVSGSELVEKVKGALMSELRTNTKHLPI